MKKALSIIIVLLLVAAAVGTAPGHAAPSGKPLQADYDRGLLEVYFKRAEDARSVDEWLSVVDQGIDVVKGRWENAVLLASGGEGATAEERAFLEGELASEKRSRLTEFLLDKFFKELAPPEIESVLQAVEEANRLYLYAKDEEGRIKIDAAGDPIFYGRVNDDTGAEFEADDDAWRAAVNARIAEVTAAWEADALSVWDNLPVAYPELLGCSDEAAGRFRLKLTVYRQRLRNECERIRAQEERAFREKRLSDQYSLRKKTDEEAAALTADRLIAGAKEKGEAGIRRVRDGLERLETEVSVDGIDVNAREWLASFEREFNKGLDVWERSEREFLRRRAEWEKEVGIRFEAGQKEWAQAYERLREARAAWEAGLLREKERGLRLWREKEEKLAVSLREAGERLNQAIDERTAGVGMQIEALFDMYLQADTVLTTAKNSIEFWQKDLEGLIARYNDECAGRVEGAKAIDAARLKDALLRGDTEGLTALAGEMAAGFSSAKTSFEGRKREFEEDLCALVDRFYALHREEPQRVMRVTPGDDYERFTDTVCSDHICVPVLSESKCNAYFDPIIKDFFTIDGRSVLAVLKQMEDYDDPRLTSVPTDAYKEVTLTCIVGFDDRVTLQKTFFKKTTTAACWTEARQAAASQYLAGEIKYYTDQAANVLKAAREMVFWLGQRAQYAGYREEAARVLAETYGLALGKTEAAEREAVNGDWSSLLLDEYQRELLAAQGESNYWKKQVTIARAVADYARDTSSDRPTEAETQAQYEAALKEFERAEADYQAAAEALSRLGRDVGVARAAYEEAKAAWEAARAALEQKQVLYKQKMGVLMCMGDEYYRNGIQSRYEELLSLYGLSSRPGGRSEAEVMAGYYAAAARYGKEARAAACARELSVLLSGSVRDGQAGLEELGRRTREYGALIVYDGGNGKARIDGDRIAETACGYADLSAAAAAYNAVLEESGAEAEETRLARLTLEAVAGRLKETALGEYRGRIEALSLLSVETFDEWVGAEGLTVEEIRARAEAAASVYLRDKALFLMQAVDGIMHGVYTEAGLAGKDELTGVEKTALALLVRYTDEGLGELARSLSSIAAIFSAGSPGALGAYREAIRSLVAEDEIAGLYFSNDGNIFSGGVDYADLFAPGLAAARVCAEERARLLERYAGAAPCLVERGVEAVLDSLGSYLEECGLGKREADGFLFADPEEAWRAALGGGVPDRGRVIGALKRYEEGLAGIGTALPSWMREGVKEYLSGLAEYFTCKLLMAEKPADTDDGAAVERWHLEKRARLEAEGAELRAEKAVLEGRLAERRRLQALLADAEITPVEKLAAVYRGLTSDGGAGVWGGDEGELPARYRLSVEAAREELVSGAAAAALAVRVYALGREGTEAELEAACDESLQRIVAGEATLKQEIFKRAGLLLSAARGIDRAMATLDFRGVEGAEARYALWRRCAPEEVRAEAAGVDVGVIRDELGKGVVNRERLRENLSLVWLEGVAGIKGEGKVYSRALYLGLRDAGFEGGELAAVWEALCGAYGLWERDEVSVLEGFISGRPDRVQEALFCYGGSAYGKIYFLKNMVLSGGEYERYADGAVKEEVERFAARLKVMKGYVPILGDDKFEYAAPRARDAVEASEGGALVEVGIEDAVLIQFESGTGGAWLEFLNIHAEGRARNLGELMAERGERAAGLLGEALRERERAAAQIERERGYIERWLAADSVRVTRGGRSYAAKYGFNYRMGLEEDNLAVSGGEALSAAAARGLAVDADSPGGLWYFDSSSDKSGYRNEELERYNAVFSAGRMLMAALNGSSGVDEAGDKLREAVSSFSVLFNADAGDDRVDDEVMRLLDGVQADEEAMRRAEGERLGVKRRASVLKVEAAGAAEALETVQAEAADYEGRVIVPLREELRALEAGYEAAGAVLEEKKGPFLEAEAAYRKGQSDLKGKYDVLEAKRLELQAKEEIVEYAKSIYLKPNGGEETLGVDPEARLKRAQFEFEKADAVYRTLEALYGSEERRRSVLETNGELKAAYEAYGSAYRAFLRMKEAERLVEEAVRIQRGKVEAARREAYKVLADFRGGGGLALLSREVKEGDENGAYEEWRARYGRDGDEVYTTAEYWLRYFELPGAEGTAVRWPVLKLTEEYGGAGSLSGYGLAELFPDAGTENDLALLKEFQEKADDYVDSERFMEDFEEWAYRLTQESDLEGLMEKWENAYYFLMEEAATGGLITRSGSLYEEVPVYRTPTQPGEPDDIVEYYAKRLKGEYTEKRGLIRRLVEPFTEKVHDEDHWYDVWSGEYRESGNYNSQEAAMEERIIAGESAFKELRGNEDFAFFVFVVKTGLLSGSAFEWREKPTEVNWPNVNFTRGYRYRDYKRFDSEMLALIEGRVKAYREERDRLGLLEGLNGREEAGALVDAVVEAVKLVKPAGFRGGDIEAAARGYFGGAVERYYEEAREAYGRIRGAESGKKAADMAGLAAGAAALERARLKAGLDRLIERLRTEQEGVERVYREALRAVKEARTGKELEAALGVLVEASRAALKESRMEERDVLLGYYRLYESMVSEYVDGFRVSGGGLFEPTCAARGIEAGDAVYEEVRSLMGLQEGVLMELYGMRLGSYAQVQTEEMGRKLHELGERKREWTAKMEAIIQRGRDEWNAAGKRYEEAWRGWTEAFGEEYERKSVEWEKGYEEFLRKKNDWVAGAEEKLAGVGEVGVMTALGVEAEGMTGVMDVGAAGDIGVLTVNAGEVAAELLGTSLFTKIARYAEELNGGVARGGWELNGVLAGSGIADGQVLARVEAFLADRREEISEHTAQVTARTAERSIEEAIEGLKEQVEESNRNVERNVGSMLEDAGYSRSGGAYSREAITGSSVLGGNQFETQTIGSYVYYKPPRFASEVDLSAEGTRGLDQEGVNALVERAVRGLRNQLAVVMGEKGEFQEWVGKKAELKGEGVDPGKEIGENLSEYGSGELGRIFRVFLDYELKRNKGEAEARAPFYNKPLWGEFLGIEGPSIRSLIDMGLTIVTKPLMGIPAVGAVANMFINSLDDLMFMCADIATGALTEAQAGLAFGQKALVNIISMGMGAVGGAVSAALNFGTDALGVIGKTMMTGVQSLATNAATGLVTSLEVDSSGNLSWNAEKYREGLIGRQALAGYFGGMAGTALSEGLNAGILGKERRIVVDKETNRTVSVYERFEGMDVKNVQALTGLAGNALNGFVEYGISGQTTLSLLRINDVGVFELRLGGGRKTFGIGMNGIDVSAGRIASSVRGIYDIHMNNLITSAAVNAVGGGASAREKAAKLRMLYSYGDDVGRRTLYNMLAGQEQLVIGSEGLEGVQAEVRGKTVLDGSGSRVMFARSSLSDDFNVWLAESTTLEHEAYRDGRIGTEAEQKAETLRATRAHTEMALRLAQAYGYGFLGTDNNLARDVSAYYFAQQGKMSFEDYVNKAYDASADYWKLMKDGRIVYDGNVDLWDESGTVRLRKAKKRADGKNATIESSFAEFTGMPYVTDADKDRVAREMKKAGFVYDETYKGKDLQFDPNDSSTWMWHTGAAGIANAANKAGYKADKRLIYSLVAEGQIGRREAYEMLNAQQQAPERVNLAPWGFVETLKTVFDYNPVSFEEWQKMTFNQIDKTSIYLPNDLYYQLKDPSTIFKGMMTPEIAVSEKYAPKIGDNGVATATYCNVFVYDKTKTDLGEQIHDAIFEGKPNAGAKALFIQFENNRNLEALDPSSWTLDKIQSLADEGYIIIASGWRSKGSGHVAFIGPSDLSLWGIPSPINNGLSLVYPPQSGVTLSPSDSNTGLAGPTIVMAGSYNGVFPFNYGFGNSYRQSFTEKYYHSGYTDKKNITHKMRFYRVRR